MSSSTIPHELYELEELVTTREQAGLLLDMIDRAIDNSRGALVLMGSLLERWELREPTATDTPAWVEWKAAAERLNSIEGALYGQKSLGEEYLVTAREGALEMHDGAAAAVVTMREQLGRENAGDGN